MAAPRALLPRQAARHACHALGLQRQRLLQPLSLTPSVPRRLVVVSAGLQRPLTSAERKAKRAEAARLGKDLVAVTLGQKGLSPAFLQGLATALAANELIKVRLSRDEPHLAPPLTAPAPSLAQVRVGSDSEMAAVAEELERECDCVVVHKIGFVLTLYRDSTLAPPPCLRGGEGAGQEADEEEGAGDGAGGKKKKKGGKDPLAPPAPPEFTIL